MGELTLDRFVIFCAVTLIVVLYNKSIRVLDYLYEYCNCYDYIQKNKDYFIKVLWYLTRIQKWKNPILALILKIDNVLYKLFKKFNSILIKKLKTEKYQEYYEYIVFFYYWVEISIFGVIKIIYHVIYNILLNIRNVETLYELLVKRFYGYAICVLVYSDAYKYIYKYIIENNIKGLIKIYIFHRWLRDNKLSFLLKKGKYSFRWILYDALDFLVFFIKLSLSSYVSIIWKRNSVTYLGLIIEGIVLSVTNVKVGHNGYKFKDSEILLKDIIISLEYTNFNNNVINKNVASYYKYIYIKDMLDLQYKDVIGIFDIFIKVDFLYLWEYNKLIDHYQLNNSNMVYRYNNILNYPPLFLFNYIIKIILDTREIAPFKMYMNLLYYEEYPEIKLNEKTKLALLFLKEFDLKRIELISYLFYDMYSLMKEKDKEIIEYPFFFSTKSLFLYEIFIDEYILKVLKCNDFMFKRENKFYDLDNNLNFFIEVFKYYSIIDDVIRCKSNSDKFEDENSVYIMKELEYYSKVVFYVKSELNWKYECLDVDRQKFFKKEIAFIDIDSYYQKINEKSSKVGDSLYILINDIKGNWNKERNTDLINRTYKELDEIYKKYKKILDIEEEYAIKEYYNKYIYNQDLVNKKERISTRILAYQDGEWVSMKI